MSTKPPCRGGSGAVVIIAFKYSVRPSVKPTFTWEANTTVERAGGRAWYTTTHHKIHKHIPSVRKKESGCTQHGISPTTWTLPARRCYAPHTFWEQRGSCFTF